MKLNRTIYYVTAFILVAIATSNKVEAQKNWYKGNTHTHTTYSDGKLAPEAVVDLYKNEGYDFLFITDHGKVAPIDEALLSSSDFLCIKGEESESYHHLSCLNINNTIKSTFPPEILNSTISQGGFIIVNHPMRGNHVVHTRDIWDVEEIEHIEIVNTKSEKDGYHDDQSLWDSILTAGKLIYGVAADDFHETKHLAKGWIMVLSDTLQIDSIIKAIKEGQFYASTGLNFSVLEANDTLIKIKAPDADKIEFIGNNHTVFKSSNSDSANYSIKGDEGYIRVVASNLAGEKAFSQPLFWNKTFQGIKADTTIAKVVCEGESNISQDCIYYITEESAAGTDSVIKVHASVIAEPGILARSEYSINPDDTLELKSVSQFESYLWNTTDTVSTILINGVSPGELKFWLRVKHDVCYFTDTVIVTVVEPSGVNRIKTIDKSAVYPNPASSFVTLKSNDSSGITAFTIYNMNGSIVTSGDFSKEVLLDISNLNQGVYFVRLNNGTESKNTKLFVIR